MKVQDNVAVVRSFAKAVSNHDVEGAVSLLDKDVEWKTDVDSDGTIHGREIMALFISSFLSTFPDYQLEIVNVIPAGDHVVAEYIGRGTHSGPMNTPFGLLLPTGRRMEVRSCVVHQIKNGKIVSGHDHFDSATMLEQLGVLRRTGQKAA